MSLVNARMLFAAVAFCTFFVAPARACDTGPWPVEFVGNSDQLSTWDKQWLYWLAYSAKQNPKNVVLLNVYDASADKSSIGDSLKQRRIKAIKTYLASLPIKEPRVLFVSIAGRAPDLGNPGHVVSGEIVSSLSEGCG